MFFNIFRLLYDSTIKNVKPSAYSSQLTSIQNTDSSYPVNSNNENYRSVASNYPSEAYRSYGSGSESYGPLLSPGFVSSYPSAAYGLRPESHGYSGFSGSYYGQPELYGPSEPCGLSEPCGSSEPCSGPSPSSVIPTSLSNYIPHQGGINIAQQIVHKPVVTELQEVIHKPIITEVQEIVNKPVISEVQQVIHKPLFTEHIGLRPSYHGYQKHVVNQPIYHKPTKYFVRHPVSQTSTIHLADEYEQIEPGTGSSSSYGFTGSSFPITHGSGVNVAQPCGQYKSIESRYNVAPYEPVYSRPVSSSYSSSLQASTPYNYPTMSYNNLGSINHGKPYGQQIATFNTGNQGPYRSIEESSLPKAAEQIMYDKFLPYTQQSNANQQYNNDQLQQQLSGFQQQRGRSNEDPKQIKMDVDAIAKQIEKNPEMRRQLIKIITESIYVGDQMNNKKQQDTTSQSLPLV